MKLNRYFRKRKHQVMKRNKRATDYEVDAMHSEMIGLREEVRAMKGAMRDLRDEIADLTGKAQSEIADLE